MNGLMRFYRAYGRIVGCFAVIAGIAAFAMMWLVDANVLGRKLLNQPVMVNVEISQALLVFCIMVGLPYAQVTGTNLRVTLIVGVAPRRLAEVLLGLSALIGCVLFALLMYSSFSFTLRAWRVGEEVWGASVRFPLWPVKAVVPLGAGLLSLQFLLNAIRVLVFRAVLSQDDIAGGVTATEKVRPMTETAIGFVGIAGAIGAILLGVNVMVSLAGAGLLGITILVGPNPALTLLNSVTFTVVKSFVFTVIPCFLLMGFLAMRAGLGEGLFQAATRWFGHLPGGLAIVSTGSAPAFGAASGSRVGTILTATRS